jgi:hypothetical protein
MRGYNKRIEQIQECVMNILNEAQTPILSFGKFNSWSAFLKLYVFCMGSMGGSGNI